MGVINITRSPLTVGGPYLHSGSGGGGDGPPTHPHAVIRFGRWLAGLDTGTGGPMKPGDSRWKGFRRWIKSVWRGLTNWS